VTPESLAALCAAAMPDERLTPAELDVLCFSPGDEIVEHNAGAAAFTVKRFGDVTGAWMLLVAVAPEHQGVGAGERLMRGVVERARALGATNLFFGFLAPRYVWPGLDAMNTAAGGLAEKLGFEWGEVSLDMGIPTAFRARPPEGVHVEREGGRGASDLAARAFPHWVEEVERAVAQGTAFAARAGGETVGFACHSVWRAGNVGPMATDPDRQHGGVGSALLAALCADLAPARDVAQISWVSNLRFYGKCGATVSRVYRSGRLPLSG
jgi:GNAT superfamily N-acetyltransferase